MAISIHNPIRIRVCDEFLVIVRHVKSVLSTLAAIVGAGAPCGVSIELHQAKSQDSNYSGIFLLRAPAIHRNLNVPKWLAARPKTN
jgi:hypothetical protein